MRPLRIHATNLTGMGSRRLAAALVPELLRRTAGYSTLYLPHGDKFITLAQRHELAIQEIRRRLPNALSRFGEVTFGARRYQGAGDLLVLGDLPLAGLANQTVLVHNPFLLAEHTADDFAGRMKVALLRKTFALTQKAARRIIVQTPSMRDGLISRYAIDPERIVMIGQPPPDEILDLPVSPIAPDSGGPKGRGLNLFYPSRYYPHKRHSLLNLAMLENLRASVDRIALTVQPKDLTSAGHPLLDCIGEVSMERVAQEYLRTDALLFLSKSESYGLPLLEAIWLNLPIVCPDLPYARDILGENRFFFRPDDPASLVGAIDALHEALAGGWRADWSHRRKLFPRNWQEVASRFLGVVRP